MKTRKVISLKRWISTHSGGPDNLTNYAKGWFDLPKEARILYIIGHRDGFVRGCLDANTTFIQTREELTPANEAVETRAISTARLHPETFTGLITKLYLNPQNKPLPWDIICMAAIKILLGTPRKDVEKDLKALNRIFTETYKPNR